MRHRVLCFIGKHINRYAHRTRFLLSLSFKVVSYGRRCVQHSTVKQNRHSNLIKLRKLLMQTKAKHGLKHLFSV